MAVTYTTWRPDLEEATAPFVAQFAWLTVERYRAKFDDAGVLPAGIQLAVDDDGAVVGHVMAVLRYIIMDGGAQRMANIGQVGVADSHRGQGIGRALMRRGLAYAREQGCRGAYLSTLTTLVPAFGMYQRLGFRLACRGAHVTLEAGSSSAARVRPLATSHLPALRGLFDGWRVRHRGVAAHYDDLADARDIMVIEEAGRPLGYGRQQEKDEGIRLEGLVYEEGALERVLAALAAWSSCVVVTNTTSEIYTSAPALGYACQVLDNCLMDIMWAEGLAPQEPMETSKAPGW